jgi:hypothetical protein
MTPAALRSYSKPQCKIIPRNGEIACTVLIGFSLKAPDDSKAVPLILAFGLIEVFPLGWVESGEPSIL